MFIAIALLLSLASSQTLNSFISSTETVRVFEKVLDFPTFDKVVNFAPEAMHRYVRESEVGTFWFPFSRPPSNPIEETISLLRGLANVTDEWKGAEWYYYRKKD